MALFPQFAIQVLLLLLKTIITFLFTGFPGTFPLEPVVKPTTQPASLLDGRRIRIE
jgi:hypothetical protein